MEKREVLERTKLFDMLSEDELDMLSTLFKTRVLKDGETVFEQGDEGDGLYILAKGDVEIVVSSSGEETVLATLTAPEFFGEMSVIDKEFRSATVRSKGHTELFFLSVENLLSFRRAFRDGFTFVVINIARVMSSRLREANQRLARRE